MTTGEQKAFCVPQFPKTESVITVQRTFQWTCAHLELRKSSREPTVTGSAYLDALQLWLLPHLEESEPDNFIWQQDGAQWHLSVRDWLNITVPDQWISRKGLHDKACFAWPPRSTP
ncbi:uncharacterized protein TNCV_4540311 [Trichonephila clavipes]|nr:uncharacterized protein TNCV_4540311 [Trichonephila clavipes]